MRRILLIGLAKSQYKIKLRKFKNTQHSAWGGGGGVEQRKVVMTTSIVDF